MPKANTTPETDPVADILLGLHGAITKISKSKSGDPAADMRAAFEAAYGELNGTVEETAEMAFAAGIAKAHDGEVEVVDEPALALKKAKKKPAADEDDPEDPDDDEDDEDMEKVLKSANPRVRSFVETIMKANTAMATRVATLEEKDRDVVAKARAAEIGEPDSFAALLKSLDKVDTTGALSKTVMNVVKSKNDQLKTANLFKELGGGQGADGSGSTAEDQLVAKANEIVKASGGKTTFAKAFTEVCKLEPDLYKQHKAGR